MQRELQITFHRIQHSASMEDLIRAKAAALEALFDHITGCHVTIEAPHHNHRKGNLYLAKVHVSVPGREIVVGREHAHEDAYVAIRGSFEAAMRQLEDTARKRHDRRRRAEPEKEIRHGDGNNEHQVS